jgi:hypothetical protein
MAANDQFFIDETPAENPNMPNEETIFISANEFANGIWLFAIDRNNNPFLKGLYRDGIIRKLETMGYYKRCRNNNSYIFIQERNNIIREVEPFMMKDDFFDAVKAIIETLDFEYGDYQISIQPEKLRETLLRQDHLIFNENFLEHLSVHTKPILCDTNDEAFFFFKNKIIKIAKNGLQPLEYNAINNECIWSTQIIDRDLIYNIENKDCHFARFIKNVCNNEQDRISAFLSAIGYLLHNYSHPSKGQAIIAYDEEITDLKNPMGGTGKGLLANALKQLRNVAKIDGKKFDPNDKFKFQDITESTQIVWMDDVKPELGFETFHSVLTDGWSIEKKFKQQFFIKPEDSPKMFICSNAILSGNGTTNKRRQFIIEFSNHYSKQIKIGNEQPIVKEHGCIFFDKNDWNFQEWNMFYSFMLDCVQKYLQDDLISYTHRGLNKNRLHQSTNDDFCNWAEQQDFNVDKQYNTKEKFEDFRDTYYGTNSDFKQRGFTNWLKKFAESKDWKFVVKSSDNTQYFIFLSG